MPNKIFISYRRQDSAANALGISQYLEHEFGRKNVFIDVDMRAGTKFPVLLEQRLAECKVMLVLVGPEWLDARDEDGHRRLDDPDDWVRLEIAHALKRDIVVIPVRINGAALPAKAALPEDIRGLLDHQAVSVTVAGFRNEMAGLARDIRSISKSRHWGRVGAIAIGACLTLGMLALYQVPRAFEHIRPGVFSQIFEPAKQNDVSKQNDIWSSTPGEWVFYAFDKQPNAYYFKPNSVKAFGDKVVYTDRFPLKSTNTSPQADKSSLSQEPAYEDDTIVLDCKKPIFANADKTVYNKNGEVISHFTWGDPESLDLSRGGSINPNSILALSQHIMCDEQLRVRLLSKEQIENTKFSFLATTPTGDGDIFYGSTKEVSELSLSNRDVIRCKITRRS